MSLQGFFQNAYVTHDLDRAITLCGAAVIGLAVAFGALSLSRFHAAEVAWEEHNARATAIGEAQTEINRHIGYGGFIHNVKNLVLRRDPMRYQARIESDIVNFRAQFDRLDHLLREPGDKAALNQVEFAPIEAKLSGVGTFPKDGAPVRVLWAGIQPEEALRALHQKIETALVKAGCQPQSAQEFQPHIEKGMKAKLKFFCEKEEIKIFGKLL